MTPPTLPRQIAAETNELHLTLLEMVGQGYPAPSLHRLRDLVLRAENALAIACEAAVEAHRRAVERAFALRGCE